MSRPEIRFETASQMDSITPSRPLQPRDHPDRVEGRRLRAARERGTWIRQVWDRLTWDEQVIFAEVAINEVSAGQPVPPFTTYAAEAADWASWAHPRELVAYAAACLVRIPEAERRRLWALLQRARL